MNLYDFTCDEGMPWKVYRCRGCKKVRIASRLRLPKHWIRRLDKPGFWCGQCRATTMMTDHEMDVRDGDVHGRPHGTHTIGAHPVVKKLRRHVWGKSR